MPSVRTQTPNTGWLPTASTLAAWQSHKVTWSKAQQPSPTRMRPPVVKRQPTPESGFLLFSALSGRCQQTVSCSDWLSIGRRNRTWRPQTRLEVLSPPKRRVQRRVGARWATEQCLRSLLPSSAKRGLTASTWSRESQARVRSRTRRPWATSAANNRSASGGPITGAGGRVL